MLRPISFTFICLLFSASLYAQNNHQKSRYKSDSSGPEIATYLNEDYNSTPENCGTNSEPAFLCSGVMIRAALPGAGYHIWDPSPSAQTTGGISFSYIRADDNSLEFVHNETSGFIFYPYFYAPDGKDTNINILCSFPLDADTVNRDNNGCGQHSGNYPKSGACQSQGITTAQQWYANGTSMDGQCGFDVSDDSTYNTADAFIQTIKARTLLNENERVEQNEIRLKTWAENMQNTLPVEAFWYTAGDATGLANAQYNQEDFFYSTTNHLVVPVIMMTPPSSTSGKYIFTYRDEDQWIKTH
ncbi:HvnC protein [Enterobacter asburiae]|uniref:HvnC protein n=1 Tax=Enterobacter asburiae TaxID=61645 RepID=UPI0020039C28|nr:HvnC protein [Enterobacter asburiae]MCK7226322.1 HvnC protein [Enterobacter asburiae]